MAREPYSFILNMAQERPLILQMWGRAVEENMLSALLVGEVKPLH